MTKIPFIKELQELNLPKDQFAIFGSSLLQISKIRKANDLDILVTKKLRKKLAEQYPNHVVTPTQIKIGNLEIMSVWHTMEKKTQTMIKDAEYIQGHPFVQRKYLLESKRNMQRTKDIFDIHLILKYIKKHMKRLVFLHMTTTCLDFLANQE